MLSPESPARMRQERWLGSSPGGPFRGRVCNEPLPQPHASGPNCQRPTVLELLRHDDPQIRADACRFAQPSPEMVAQLRDLLDDLQHPVRMAATCALGLMGRNEVRPLLARYLREEPSAQLIDAVGPVADEECIILLGRIARTMPDLMAAALDALDATDHPRALRIAVEIGAPSSNG